MNLLFLTALIPISISILLIAPSHVFATSNQTSSNETTNNLLKQILNELQQIRQFQQHPVLPTPSPPTNPGCGLGTDNSLCNVPVPPFLSPPPPFNATTCKPQNDNGVLVYPCLLATFPSLEQPLIPPPAPLPPHLENILPPPANLPPIPPSPPFLANLPPDLGMGPVTDCIYTVYGVFCPTN